MIRKVIQFPSTMFRIATTVLSRNNLKSSSFAGRVSLRLFSDVSKFPKKPIILLDIDGVINMAKHEDPSQLWNDHIKVSFDYLDVVFSPELVEKINKWNKVAEVRWCTFWDQKAPTILAPALKLDDFMLAEGRVDEEKAVEGVYRVANPNNLKKQKYLSKIDSAVATAVEIGPDRLIIWIDDELDWWSVSADKNQGFLFANKPIFSRPNTVLIRPRCGLTKEHVQFVNDLLANPELAKDQHVRNFEK